MAGTNFNIGTRTTDALRIAISVALTTWTSGHLMAQDPDSQNRNQRPEKTEIDEVHVIGQQSDTYKADRMSSPQFTANLLDTAKTVHVITSEIMRDQGTDSLTDILNNVPGISMQAGEGGTPAGDQLSIRGFSARTDIFVDGTRDFGGYTRDSYNLEQVEVAKGPGSSYSGRGSTGGSINLVSKTARAEDFISGTGSFGNADYKRGTLDVNRQLGDTTAIRLNVLAHNAEVPDRDQAENTRYGIAPSLSFGLGTDTVYTLSYAHLQQDNVPDYGIPWVPATNTNATLVPYRNRIAPVDDSNWYGLAERDYEEIRNDLITGKIEHAFSENVVLSNQLRWGRTDRDSMITAPRFVADVTSTNIRRTDWKSRDQKSTILNNLTSLTIDFDTGGIQHSLAAGIELSDEEELNHARTDTGAQPDTDLFNPTPDDAWGGTLIRTGAFTEGDGFSTSAFVADTVTLNEHWLVTGGLRWDRFKLDYANVPATGVASELSRTDKEWSYQGSIVYKPVRNGSIYAGYGTSFNPSSEGLSLSNAGVAAVKPEESNTIELGTKWELFDEHLFLNAALFRTEKTNARESDPVTTGLTVLSGEQKVEGIELGAVGRLTDAWSIVAGYTWMDSEVTASVNPALVGVELANTPKNTFSLWTTYKIMRQLEFGLGTSYVDKRFSSTNMTNVRTAPAYQLVNAMVAYEVNQNLSFRLNATNLTDKDYLGSVGGGHSIPGDGRSVIISVSFNL